MTLFGTRLLDAMHMRDVTAAELARKTTISESNISRYLSGTSMPSMRNLLLLADALGISSDWLAGRDEEDGEYHIVYGDKEIVRIFKSLSTDSQEKVLEYAEMLLTKEMRNV